MAATSEARTIAKAVKKHGGSVCGTPSEIKRVLELNDMSGSVIAAVLRSARVPNCTTRRVEREVFEIQTA